MKTEKTQYFTVPDLWERGWDGVALRFFLDVDRFIPTTDIDPKTRRTYRTAHLYSTEQVTRVEGCRAFRAYLDLSSAEKPRRADELYRRRVASVVSSLELELPQLVGSSKAHIEFASYAREEQLFYIRRAVLHMQGRGAPQQDTLSRVHNIFDNELGRQAHHWIAHRERIRKRHLDPVQYWCGRLTSPKASSKAAQSASNMPVTAASPHESESCD